MLEQISSVLWCAELGIDIEERGLVVNWSTFRFAFCQGGDGESDMTMDVQDLAMFVRDPGSVVTCILLPLSASMHMHQQVSPLSVTFAEIHSCAGNHLYYVTAYGSSACQLEYVSFFICVSFPIVTKQYNAIAELVVCLRCVLL